MASGDSDGMEFQQRRGTMANFQSLQMGNNGGDPFFGPGWDQVVSLSQSQNFGASSMVSQAEVTNSHYPVVMEHQGMNNSASQFSQYPSSSSGFVELALKIPCFGSGNFTEMMGSFGLPQCSQVTSSGCATSYAPNRQVCNEMSSANGKQSDEQHQTSEDGKAGASLSEKRRKRVSESIYSMGSRKNAEDQDSQKDTSGDGSDLGRGQDEKRLKTEQNASPNSLGKQCKEASQGGEAPKDNYIHVRARRGQATNSHSLAERVRREKISERMRLLQELVPGCNKITGKAVMLDEIINYVQSLQQQVEFLSMKLATVNPELNIDLERLLSKDILHPQGRNATLLGLGAGINSSHPFPTVVFPGSLSTIPSSNAHFPPFSQAAVSNDFHSLFQMGYESTSTINNSLGPNSNGDDPSHGLFISSPTESFSIRLPHIYLPSSVAGH